MTSATTRFGSMRLGSDVPATPAERRAQLEVRSTLMFKTGGAVAFLAVASYMGMITDDKVVFTAGLLFFVFLSFLVEGVWENEGFKTVLSFLGVSAAALVTIDRVGGFVALIPTAVFLIAVAVVIAAIRMRRAAAAIR